MSLPTAKERKKIFAKAVAEKTAKNKVELDKLAIELEEARKKQEEQDNKWFSEWYQKIDNEVINCIKRQENKAELIIRQTYFRDAKCLRREQKLVDYCKKAGYDAEIKSCNDSWENYLKLVIKWN